MVGQGYFSVNTGFYGIDFGHHIQQGCFPFPGGYYTQQSARNLLSSRDGLRSVHPAKTFDYKPLVEGPASLRALPGASLVSTV